jgi:hypothetical protein
LADLILESLKIGNVSFAPETKNHVAGEKSVTNQLAGYCTGTATKQVSDNRVSTFRRDDDANSIYGRCTAIPNEVVCHTLIPTSNQLAKIARFNNPVVAGEH